MVSGVCEVGNMLQNMNTDNKGDADISVCANCGKDGSNLKSCTACKMVKYCSRECQIAHRPQHKKKCSKRAKELHDIELFKQPPPAEDCPICFVRLPTFNAGSAYMSCCGKVLCCGCMHAPVYDNQGNKVDNQKCPFCRTQLLSTNDEEIAEREKKRMEVGDPEAMFNIGSCYRDGSYGYPQDYTKSLELYHRAAELGYSKACICIGVSYFEGRGVEVDHKKAVHYYELSAMGGESMARHNLGNIDARAGNFDRALKHFMIAASGGADKSLNNIKEMYLQGDVTKKDYTKALQLYQVYLGEIKSPQRDKAAAYDNERFRYY